MISNIIKTGLNASIKPSTQIQAKRFLYPKSKDIIVRRKGPNEIGVVEKGLYFVITVAVFYSYPFWAMLHFENYRNGNK